MCFKIGVENNLGPHYDVRRKGSERHSVCPNLIPNLFFQPTLKPFRPPYYDDCAPFGLSYSVATLFRWSSEEPNWSESTCSGLRTSFATNGLRCQIHTACPNRLFRHRLAVRIHLWGPIVGPLHPGHSEWGLWG